MHCSLDFYSAVEFSLANFLSNEILLRLNLLIIRGIVIIVHLEVLPPPDLVSAEIVQCLLHYFWYFHVVWKNLCMFMTGMEAVPNVTGKHLVLRRRTWAWSAKQGSISGAYIQVCGFVEAWKILLFSSLPLKGAGTFSLCRCAQCLALYQSVEIFSL